MGRKPKYMRLVGPDGEFVSSYKCDEDTISIGYLDELCEYTFYHNNKTDKVKLKEIKLLEGVIQDLLNKMIVNGCKYIPTWSKKLERKIGRTKK